MANFPQVVGNRPGFWRAFGHSYLESQAGVSNQTGRADAAFRDQLSILFNEWQNWAVTGSRLFAQGVAQGGYARVLQAIPGVVRGAPYVSNGGASINCWGINDMGNSGTSAGYLSAFLDAYRTVISRQRMATIRENTDASISYGAGFGLASNSTEWTSGDSYRTATVTTNANFTITLPSDYDGSPVVLCFNGIFNGGTGTFSGTAGVTGTFSTSAIIPAAVASHCPRIKRITNLTSANAGQTIIFTVNSIDASGSVDFDAWWIEAATPPPVIVCDIPKLNSTGYAGYTQMSGNSVAVNDALVDTWNDGIYRMVAEFDSMVQVAWINAALNKTAAWLWTDGVHPNEYGTGQFAGAMADAVDRLTPPDTRPAVAKGLARSPFINSSAPRGGQLVKLHNSQDWATADCRGFETTGMVPVAGTMWALPIQFTKPTLRIIQFSMAMMTTWATGTCTIRWGLYDDPGATGYPFSLMHELTSGGAFSVATGTAVQVSPLFPTAGFIDKPVDPGVYWLTGKWITIGTTPGAARSLQGPNLLMPNLASTGFPNAVPAATTMPVGLTLAGQGSGAFPSKFPTGATMSDRLAYIGIKFQ